MVNNQETIPREVQFAWLAGVFDGEGNLGFFINHKGKTGHRQIMHHVNFTNTSRKLLDKIHEILDNNSINHSERVKKSHFGKKDCYRIEVTKVDCKKRLLELMYPYLTDRRAEAKIMIDFFIKYPDLNKSYSDLPRSGTKKILSE
jgi:hypothetical protein